MRIFITIIFTFLFSLSYAQPADWGYWETVPLKNVQMLTPKMIKEKLSETIWTKVHVPRRWFVKDGSIMENRFVYTALIDGLGFRTLRLGVGKDEYIKYDYTPFSPEYIMEREICPFHENKFFFVDGDETALYFCVEDFRTDGSLFEVVKLVPINRSNWVEWKEKMEILYCMVKVYYTILDKMGRNHWYEFYASTLCSAPQNPDVRVELPYQKIKKTRRRVRL
ncbi:MAG: hypothetical protein IKM12_07080 [Alistipes sp.]|nr:hypothetical protein [Alistipes sp.]